MEFNLKEFKYKLTKVNIFKYIVCTLLLVLSIKGIIYSQGEITPKTVHVSGYTRKDGIKVNSYKRRPPGSVKHDFPYEVLLWFSVITSFINIVWLISLITDFRDLNTVRLFMEDISWKHKYPEVNYKYLNDPLLNTRPNKDWICDLYYDLIGKGTIYYHYTKSKKNHICKKCKIDIKNQIEMYKKSEDNYFLSYNFVTQARIKQLKKEYLYKFRKHLKKPENYLHFLNEKDKLYK